MTKIGLLSDTHGYWDERYLKYFEPCDEIWHAGDIGSMEIIERLEAFRPLRAVYGNIDGHDMYAHPPKLFISGHSHILKVKFDPKLNLLHINPGAAGKYGFHQARTLVRFCIHEGSFSDLEVIELNG